MGGSAGRYANSEVVMELVEGVARGQAGHMRGAAE